PDVWMVFLRHLAANLSERHARAGPRPKHFDSLAGEYAEATHGSRDGATDILGGARRNSTVLWRLWGHSLRSGNAASRSRDWQSGADPAIDSSGGLYRSIGPAGHVFLHQRPIAGRPRHGIGKLLQRSDH